MSGPRPSRRLRAAWRLVLRSFLIQGSWNYRTLLGSGVAWALLPFLPKDRAAGEALGRAGRPFNANPYLASLALGALVRLEEDGEDAERLERFKGAVRGPLGSLGDGLVWAGWRPVCLLAAVTWAVLGGGPWAVIATFLLLYNLVCVGLRAWGAHVGIERGFGVGMALGDLQLPRWTERITTVGVLVVGVLVGALAGRGVESLPNAFPWLVGGAIFLLAGVLGGSVLGRWAPGILLFLIIIGMLTGPGLALAG